MFEPISHALLMQWSESVIDLAISNVNTGGLPFAAIIVDEDGQIIGKGVNQVATHVDCTAHAEIQAIRNASLNQNNTSLSGSTLIASGEPCALCYMAILMAKIRTVVILADRQEAMQCGFDYLWTYKYFNRAPLHELTVVKSDNERKMLPFKLCKLSLSASGL